jgi:hypothetical protein
VKIDKNITLTDRIIISKTISTLRDNMSEMSESCISLQLSAFDRVPDGVLPKRIAIYLDMFIGPSWKEPFFEACRLKRDAEAAKAAQQQRKRAEEQRKSAEQSRAREEAKRKAERENQRHDYKQSSSPPSKTDGYEAAVEILGLPAGEFSREQARSKYLHLVKHFASDAGGSNRLHQQINDAWDTVKRRHGWK